MHGANTVPCRQIAGLFARPPAVVISRPIRGAWNWSEAHPTRQRLPRIADCRRSTPPSWRTGSHASSTMGSRAAAWVGRGSASGRKAARAPRNCARTCEPPARAARCNEIEPEDRSDLREYGRVDPYFIPSFKAKRRGYGRSVERFAIENGYALRHKTLPKANAEFDDPIQKPFKVAHSASRKIMEHHDGPGLCTALRERAIDPAIRLLPVAQNRVPQYAGHPFSPTTIQHRGLSSRSSRLPPCPNGRKKRCG